jgi:hypothetical protein
LANVFSLEMILRDVAQHTDEATAAAMAEAFNAGACLLLLVTQNTRDGRLTAFHWDATKPITPDSQGSA